MTPYNIWIDVDLNKIRNNVRRAKALINGHANVMAIVKANAYGHGMVPVAHALKDMVEWFGVSCFQEAATLRKEGITQPILVLGAIMPYEYEAAIDQDITLSVSEMAYAKDLQVVAERKKKKCRIHLKIDTGMGRWGFSYTTAFEDIVKISHYAYLSLNGIFTHFPVSDQKGFDYTDRQVELFKELIDRLEDKGIVFPYVHAANSGGIMHFRDSHFNLVRPGIMLYGYYPCAKTRDVLKLERALTLKSRVGLIKDVSAHRGIGYGRRFITQKKTRIAVVPIGYSHGYSYALSRKSSVLIDGKRYAIAGNVCMDYIMVDIGTDNEIRVGDEVVLLGESGNEIITAYELAEKAKTISYEIITKLSPHIPRVYSE